MYRLLLISVIVVAAEACRPPPCHWGDGEGRQLNNYFEQVANALIQADKRAKEYCNAHTKHRVKYLFGENEFKMAINCSGFKKQNYDLKSRNRVLLISAHNCDTNQMFSDVKIIPQYLNVYRSNWAYENNELVITMPYVFGHRYGSWQKTCDDINEAVHDVPEATGGGEFNEYDYS